MKFLLDTNFILIPGKFKVDVFSELGMIGKPELYTLDLVVEELGRIKGGGLGMRLLERHGVKVLKSQMKNADDEIDRIAEGYVVCTQDRELIKRVKKKARVVTLRQGKYIADA